MYRNIKTVWCDFLGKNRLGTGPVEIKISATRSTTHNISGKNKFILILYMYVNIHRSMLRLVNLFDILKHFL